MFNKQTFQWCLTNTQVSAKLRIDGDPEKSQGAHKEQVTAVPSSAAAATATGSLFLKSFFSENFALSVESEIHLNDNRESKAVQFALVPITKSYMFSLMALNITA